MQKVKYTNSKGESIYFDIKPPFVLQRIEGTGNVDVNLQSQKSPFQDGSTFLNAKLEPREIFVQVAILTSDSEELFKLRQKIQKVLNPKLGEGTITYYTPNGEYTIKGVVDGTPFFSNYNGDNVACQATFLCHDPFWYDANEDEYIFNAPYVPMFEFPFFSDPENDIEFGMEQESTIIINDGTTYTPLIIEFDGGIKNATLTNETTGESITINKELLFGEILEVNTSFGNRKIKLLKVDGNKENGFKYITLDSKFLQLAEGENQIRYVAEANGNVTVRLKWYKRYIGL